MRGPAATVLMRGWGTVLIKTAVMARFLANHMKPFELSDKIGVTQIPF